MNNNVVYITLSCYSVDNIRSPYYIKGMNTGLGNMLFQVASGLYFAYKNDAILCVPSLNKYFELENLSKENTIFRNIITEKDSDYNEHTLIISNENSMKNIFEYTFFNKMILQGYFENINNFNEYRNTLLDYFRPNQHEKEYLYNKYPIIKNHENLSSIHIRKGPDYDQIFSKETLDIMINYYREMIDYMIENKNIKNFFVVTNDKNYSMNIFNHEKYKNITLYYSEERDFYDVWLISLIKNNIVSQSTLAWWGSYLNECENRFILSHTKMGKIPNPEWLYI